MFDHKFIALPTYDSLSDVLPFVFVFMSPGDAVGLRGERSASQRRSSRGRGWSRPAAMAKRWAPPRSPPRSPSLPPQRSRRGRAWEGRVPEGWVARAMELAELRCALDSKFPKPCAPRERFAWESPSRSPARPPRPAPEPASPRGAPAERHGADGGASPRKRARSAASAGPQPSRPLPLGELTFFVLFFY